MAGTVGDVLDHVEDLQMRMRALDILAGQIKEQTCDGLDQGPWGLFDPPTMEWLTGFLEEGKKAMKKEIAELKAIPLAPTTSPKVRVRPRKAKQ